MKSLLLSLLIITTFAANATTYYFSASGSDANNGTSATTPWQTVAKFNSVFASKSAGDNFLFHRGDSFYGSLMISRPGAAGKPITVGAYGTGAMPVITGFTTVNAWTSLGSNIWESTAPASTLAYTNIVAVNGANTPMGRFPNSGYFHFQSHSGITSITSSDLSGATNWTGAELAVNIASYRIVRNNITAQSGSRLTYKPDADGSGFQSDNQQFIIQNDARTLDVQNEWYYNKSTKKLRMYSTGTPAGVQIATTDFLVVLTGRSYITFDNISFRGANTEVFQINHSPNISIQNCDITFSGRDGIFGSKTGSSAHLLVQNCTINHINNNGIDIPKGDFDNAIIRLNTIKNCGIYYGMIDRGHGVNGANTAQACSAVGANTLIEYNTVDSMGFMGIRFLGSNSIIQNNFIRDYCLLFNDGGGIYSWNGANKTVQSNVKILNNIILNRNTLSSVNTADYGIYLDDLSNNIEVRGNTCANSGWGIELHNVFDVKVNNNTIYNNSMASIVLITDNGAGSVPGRTKMKNIEIKNNTFFAKTATQKTFWVYAKIAPLLPPNLNSDSSYFSRPIDNNGASILTNFNDQAGQVIPRTLSNWQPYSGGDTHSRTTPKTITNVNDLRFEYNATSSPVTIALGANYVDIKNVSYPGTITLAPFASAVLIKNGATTNESPTANAGADQAITLPANNVSLNGTGTDADGTISVYSWSKISGPSGTINNANSAVTTVTGLVQGTYRFQLKITDNNGSIALDSVQITVNASGTFLPAVNPAYTENGLDYKYYEGRNYRVVPDFSTITPVKTGTVENFNISLANKNTEFSFNFTGFIDVPADGQYTFYTTSDDGSNLYIDNVLVVNNDGLHGAIEKSGMIGLKAGKHTISVGYFQQGGGSVLSVDYSGPGVLKSALPASALYRNATTNTGRMMAMNAPGVNQITSSAQVTVKVYPNPFVNNIEININGGVSGEYTLVLLDASGKTIWTKSGNKDAPAFQQSVNTGNLSGGTYFLKVIQNNITSVIELVK